MAGIVRFEDIEAWKTARQLTSLVYKLTHYGAFTKDYGLRDQFQRASVSIMSNIAEGFESRTDTQFLNYLGHAKGSAGEARSQLYVALDLQYVTADEFAAAQKLLEKASRQISRFMDYLETHPRSAPLRENAAEYGGDL